MCAFIHGHHRCLAREKDFQFRPDIMATSAAMQRRIASHLAAGVTPSVCGNRVVLQDIVLVRATGDRTPAAAEAQRQAEALGINLNMSFLGQQARHYIQGQQRHRIRPVWNWAHCHPPRDESR